MSARGVRRGGGVSSSRRGLEVAVSLWLSTFSFRSSAAGSRQTNSCTAGSRASLKVFYPRGLAGPWDSLCAQGPQKPGLVFPRRSGLAGLEAEERRSGRPLSGRRLNG